MTFSLYVEVIWRKSPPTPREHGQHKQAKGRPAAARRAERSRGCPGRKRREGKVVKLVPETQSEKNIIIVTNWIQEDNTMHLLRVLAGTKPCEAVTMTK